MSHPPLKSGQSSQISQVLEKGQLCEVAYYHSQVPPCLCQPLGQRVLGSPAVLGWASQGPLSRVTYSLDHHWTQQWVRSQIAENNRGCCISGRAKQPPLNYSVKAESVGTSRERWQGCSCGKRGSQAPDHGALGLVQICATSSVLLGSDMYSVFGQLQTLEKWRESRKQPQKTIWGLTEMSDGERLERSVCLA